MNIAVIGGGFRCQRLMDVIEQHTFRDLDPKVVAVADLNEQAPGYLQAKSKGLFVTADYNDFFKRNDIDLIIELTGSMDIYNDVLEKKSKSVRAIANATANLFWEISRVSILQKKTSQKLQATQAMYQTILNELIQEDVLVIARDYRIIDINETMLDKIGMQREDVIGQYCYKVTHRWDKPCSGEQHPCPLFQTINSKEPTQTTHVHLDKNNNKIYYSISTYPLFENGTVIAAIEFSRDITRDINIQKAMIQQEKLVSIGRLSAGVAHEINNPLTTILTTAMLLQEDLDPADPQYEELDTIAKEALRCRKIVTSLLDFARQTKPMKKECDINNLIQESVSLTKKQAAFKDVNLTHELADNIPPIFLDKGQIQQSLINLILNAIEATAPGGSITVTSKLESENKNVEIAVMDTGHGISAEDLSRVFDPFFTTKEDGNGLGLAITHGIIEQHHGTIDVVSKKGEGSTFKIKLPVKPGVENVA
ncbi:MAG: PAS domain-containing protein [Deltaproteobacteria bacterium]|nr:PAS domain-containing protein [Deltaproteobacteria bacterium]